MVCCFSSFSKEQRLNDLSEAVQHCTLCPRLCNRKKVLSDANGNVNSKILFVAEAPGRLGADRTGIPLYGDQTGDNFEVLLADVGWKREQVFITNAVLCNPCTEQGKRQQKYVNKVTHGRNTGNSNIFYQRTILQNLLHLIL
jgi:uracil-DNA glycosylase